MISGKSQYKKTDRVATFSIFSFCQYGLQRSSRTSGSALITAGAPRRSSPPCYFSYPHLSSYRRPPEWEWRRPARSLPPAASQRVRTLSQTVKESRQPSLRLPHTSWIAPYSSPRKTVFSPTWPTSLRASPFSWERRKPFWPTRHGPERVSWHSLASHSPIRRQYRRWNLCVEISLISRRRRRFFYFAFDKRLYLHSRQGLVMLQRPSKQFPESS